LDDTDYSGNACEQDSSGRTSYICDGACVDEDDEKDDDYEEVEEACDSVQRSGVRLMAMAER